MAIGKITSRAAGVAADAVGSVLGAGIYPESEYALAAYLFERIAQSERSTGERDAGTRDRAYYLDLMRQCLEVARARS